MIRLKTILSFSIIILLFNSLFAQQYTNETLQHDGEIREYKLYIPPNYDGSEAFPLLFNFHGGNGDIDSQIAISDMRGIADAENVILVYPQALPDPNDGGSTNWLHKDPTDVDDIFFVEAMINTLAAEYEIDTERVYACGYSLGGEFTFELACRLNEKIAAVGVVARTMNTATFNNCNPVHPTGILTILGTDDSISPYDGLVWGGIQYYTSADEMHGYWANYNNADAQPTITQLPNTNTSDGTTVELHTWENGDECVSINHLKVIGGGHDWPGSFGNMDIDTDTEIWNFVSQYSTLGLIECGDEPVPTNNTHLSSNTITFYPNPTSNSLTVNITSQQPQLYHIYDVSGKVVQRAKISAANNTINLNALIPNIYFLKLGNQNFKFIKN